MAKTGVEAQIDWRQFEELCKIQCKQGEICAVLDIDHKTLTKHVKLYYKKEFSQVYKEKAEFGKASLRRIQFKLAQTNAAMAIFLGKNLLGQKDDPLIDQSQHKHITIIWQENDGNGRLRNKNTAPLQSMEGMEGRGAV